MLTCQAGDYATARACWQEALTIAGDLRGKAQIAEIRAGLGILALLEGDHARSRALLEEGLALAQESAAWSLIGLVVFNLGRLARAEEDIARADALIRESLSVFRDHGDWTGVAAPLTWSGVIAVERGLLRRGVRLIGASASRQPRPWWESSHDRRAYDQRLSDARAALGEPGFAAAFAEGQTMTLDQAVAYALSDDDSVNSPPDEPRPVESIPPPATQSGGPWSAPEHPTAAR